MEGVAVALCVGKECGEGVRDGLGNEKNDCSGASNINHMTFLRDAPSAFRRSCPVLIPRLRPRRRSLGACANTPTPPPFA